MIDDDVMSSQASITQPSPSIASDIVPSPSPASSKEGQLFDFFGNKRSRVYQYFKYPMNRPGVKGWSFPCLHCGQDVVATMTTNLHRHQKEGCEGIEAAIASGAPGVTCTLREAQQARQFNPRHVDKQELIQAICTWIANKALPFTTAEDAAFRNMCQGRMRN